MKLISAILLVIGFLGMVVAFDSIWPYAILFLGICADGDLVRGEPW